MFPHFLYLHLFVVTPDNYLEIRYKKINADNILIDLTREDTNEK
jgi:hypothetical protein